MASHGVGVGVTGTPLHCSRGKVEQESRRTGVCWSMRVEIVAQGPK